MLNKEKLLALKSQLLAHKGLKRYGVNTAWLMGEKILRMFVGLFVGVWVARYLGPERYGLLSYAQSFVFLFTAVATLGLDGIVVRELVKSPERAPVLLGTAFTLKFIGALCILPLLWVGVQFTSNDSYTNLLIFIIASATIFQSFNVIDFYYQSTVMSKYVSLANVISLALSSIVKIILVLNEAPLMAFALTAVFDALVLSVGLVFFYTNKLKGQIKKWKFDYEVAKGLLTDSWPLIISSVMVSLYMKVDQIMIKEMLDTNAVGQYAAAVKLSEAWYFLPMAICSSVFPAIVNAKKVSLNLYHSRLKKLYSLLIWLGIGVAIIVLFLSDYIVSFLYGIDFQEASDVLVIHIWAGVFVCIGVASSQWLISENLQKYSSINTTLGAIINISLNYFLIKKFGILGAAISTLVAQAISAYILLFLFKQTRINFYIINKSLTRLPCLRNQRDRE